MWSIKSKSDEVLNHWLGFAEGFTFSPKEFYGAVEKAIAVQKLPGLEISQVDYPEGGLLSNRRLYLRIIRERLAFDTCASPFGTGFFFSCRTVYSPAIVRLWHILAVIAFLALVYYPLYRLLGSTFASVALAALIPAVAKVFQNVVALAVADVDQMLLKIPAVGVIYEGWFRKDTYFRQDSRLVYLETIPRLFKELAETTVAAKGVKLVRQYERSPVLGELYKPVQPGRKEPQV